MKPYQYYSVILLTTDSQLLNRFIEAVDIEKACKIFRETYIDLSRPIEVIHVEFADAILIKAYPNKAFSRSFKRIGKQTLLIINEKHERIFQGSWS